MPKIQASADDFGKVIDGSALNDIPISGVSSLNCLYIIYSQIKINRFNYLYVQIIGNQQSSLVGQTCFEKGQTKVTYRNACFLMCNTGEEKIFSKKGLVTTVAYKLGKNEPPIYALEGSVAVGATALHWIGDRLGIVKPNESAEVLASSVHSTGDVYFVPAINGLYAPSWKSDAKG